MITSKDTNRRALLVGGGKGRKVVESVSHSTACSARSSAASLWRAIDQTNKWSPLPEDPTRGTGCAFYHDRITNALMNKQRADLRAGRQKLSAQLVYVEDHIQFTKVVLAREIEAFKQLADDLQREQP